MVFKFGIFSGNIERFPSVKLQPAGQAIVDSSTMFKFESSKIKPVSDLPLGQPIQPVANFTSHAGPKVPVGVVPSAPGYKKILEMQKIFLTNDGKYVWQKLKYDRPLNLFIYALNAGGMVVTFYWIYTLAYKKK